ncbi:MAG: TetR/AcrR family transcriptional regulator C-terminal domain-containing protein [Pseudomonadota bacterium]
MNATTARQGRPQLVDRDQIVSAAMELGLDTLSMHQLARHLGVAPATLYRYVASKEALIEACVDAFCERIRLPDPQLSWQSYLEQLGIAFLQAIEASPGAHSYGTRMGPNTPAAYQILDQAFTVLLKAGLSHELTFNAYSLVVDHAFTTAAKRAHFAAARENPTQAQHSMLAMNEADLSAFPALSATLDAVYPPDFEAIYQRRLLTIIAGVERQLRALTDTRERK